MLSKTRRTATPRSSSMSPERLLAVAALVVCLSCSAGDSEPRGNGTFPSAPLAVLSSAGGKLRIEVRTTPRQPPARGTSQVQLVVSDAVTGTPTDGLNIDAVPWMPAMGHGASVKPTMQAQGQGRYLLENVGLFMPGEWGWRTQLTGGVSDSAVPVFDIP